MIVRIIGQEKYNDLKATWFLENGRVVLSQGAKYVTTVPMEELEVLLESVWIPFRQAWKDQKISMMPVPVTMKKET